MKRPLPAVGRRPQIVQSVRPGWPLPDPGQVVSAAADIVEVRGDGFSGPLAALCRWTAVLSEQHPVLATVRRRDEGGDFPGSERERIGWLAALADAASGLDIEWSCARDPSVQALLATPHVISHHDLARVPADAADLLAGMTATSAQYAKLAAAPRNAAEHRLLLEAGLAAGPRACVMALGEAGALARTLAGKLGSPLVYGFRQGSAPTAEGQVSVEELATCYRVKEQTAATRVFAVAGNPIGHSLSPRLHSVALAARGIDAVLVPLRAGTIEEFQILADVVGIEGAAITLPLKEAAARLARSALRGTRWPPLEGACNTLLRDPDGWSGGNTDREGFLRALEAAGLDRPAEALVLGAGGSARSIVAGLCDRGTAVTVCSRTAGRSAALAARFGARVLAWEQRQAAGFDLIVQTTPLGMHPRVEETPLEGSQFTPDQVVFDIVYRPRRTRLLQEAARDGATIIEGAEMFLHQATLQFELLTGKPAPEPLLRAELDAALAGR